MTFSSWVPIRFCAQAQCKFCGDRYAEFHNDRYNPFKPGSVDTTPVFIEEQYVSNCGVTSGFVHKRGEGYVKCAADAMLRNLRVTL